MGCRELREGRCYVQSQADVTFERGSQNFSSDSMACLGGSPWISVVISLLSPAALALGLERGREVPGSPLPSCEMERSRAQRQIPSRPHWSSVPHRVTASAWGPWL